MHRIRQLLFILKNIYINQKTKSSISTFLLQKKIENMKKKSLDVTLIFFAFKSNIIFILCF